jgi:PAS domain S-box-containing protein
MAGRAMSGTPLFVAGLGACAVWIALASYTAAIEPGSRSKRLFILVCVCFAFWAFGYAMVVVSPDKSSAWWWYKLSAAGWLVAPALLYRFFCEMALPRPTDRPGLWPYVAYVAAAFLLVRLLTGELVVVDFEATPHGWAEVIDPSNSWVYVYMLYVLLCTLVGLYRVHRWGSNSTVWRERRQARIIVLFGVVTVLLTSAANIFAPIHDIHGGPGLAPVILPLWGIAAFYAIVRYSMLSLDPAMAAERILATTVDGILIADPGGRIVTSNPWAERLLGRAGDELNGTSMGELFPDDAFLREEGFASRLMREPIRNREMALRTREDQDLIVSMSVSAVIDHAAATMEPAGMVLVLRDTTEQRRAELARLEAETKFETMVLSSPDLVLIHNAQGEVTYASPQARSVLGRDPDSLLGKRLPDIIYPDDEKRARAAFDAVLAGKEMEELEYRVLGDDGRIHWLAHTTAHNTDSEGVVTIQSSIREITERKQRAKQLQESQERLAAIFDSVTEGIIIGDPTDRQLVMANRSMGEMLGYRVDELVQLRLDDIYPAIRLERSHATFAKQLSGDLDVAEDVPLQRKDGSQVHVDISLAPVRFGDRPLLLACLRDVSERRQLKSALAQADRLSNMGMLAAGVAHEINNPLSYVLYNLESVSDDLSRVLDAVCSWRTRLENRFGPDAVAATVGDAGARMNASVLRDIRERFSDALGGAVRIREIARGLGRFSRVEEDRLVSVELREVIEVALNLSFNEIKYRARVVKEYGLVPMLTASEGRLAQVFLNLFINAAHAIEEGNVEQNEIRVRTWFERGMACTEIRDTGKGMDGDQLDQVFDPFFTTKEVGVGSGLGLPISNGIIQGYGGTIDVESKLGEGTSFFVRIPIHSEETVSVVTEPIARDEGATQGRLLIVDDDAAIRATMVRMLKRHEIVQAEDGGVARQILEGDQTFDAILCDMMMPNVSGMDLHAWLGEAYPDLARRLVFVTGGAYTPRAREYLSKVDNIRLDKPFDAANFKKIVGSVIREAKAEA